MLTQDVVPLAQLGVPYLLVECVAWCEIGLHPEPGVMDGLMELRERERERGGGGGGGGGGRDRGERLGFHCNDSYVKLGEREEWVTNTFIIFLVRQDSHI